MSTKKRVARPSRARHGCSAVISVTERTAEGCERRKAELEILCDGANRRKPGSRPTKTPKRVSPQLCNALAAAGHPTRARILAKLLEGPSTYQAIKKSTRLEAGPLYHHINQLRVCGLLLPKQRDLYELTRGGRNLILAVMALTPLIRDRRRRPAADAT